MVDGFQVQKAGLAGRYWTTVGRGTEAGMRALLLRQLRLYSVGRFRLLAPDGRVIEDRRVAPPFSAVKVPAGEFLPAE